MILRLVIYGRSHPVSLDAHVTFEPREAIFSL